MAECEIFAYLWLVIAIALIVIAIVLAAVYERNVIDEEGVEDAEWIIRDYCNSFMTCKECSKCNKMDMTCKYRKTIPGKWGDD